MFELEVKSGADGRIKFDFNTIFISDIHFATKQCKAKLLYQFLHHIDTPEMHLVGDIIDGWHMTTKEEYNLGPFHRQSMAKLLELADRGMNILYEPGNHDETLRGKRLDNGLMYRQMNGKSLFGIHIVDHYIYQDPKGRRFYVTHGDEFDPEIYKSDKGLAYKAGDAVISKLSDIDHWGEEKFQRDFRVAARIKRGFKFVEERVMPNLKNAESKALKEGFDGVVFGHSHLRGFKKTKSGILLVNDGCSTDDGIEFAAVDKKSNWAIIKWSKQGLKVRPEQGKQTLYRWRDLDIEDLIKVPEPIENEYTYNVDRLQRILYRLWSPLERKESLKKYADQRPLAIPLQNPKIT